MGGQNGYQSWAPPAPGFFNHGGVNYGPGARAHGIGPFAQEARTGWGPPVNLEDVGFEPDLGGYPGLDPWSASTPKHPRFWHADGNIAVRVENTDYNLHRYLFNRAGCFFPGQFGSYPAHQPYELKESKTDFDRFLSVLYPADYSAHQCQTTEEWSSVLLLADKWHMYDIRRLAINQLAVCAGPVDKIALGHRYNVTEWLGPAYMELTMRGEAITAAEGAKMGVDALVRLSALKDEVFSNLPAFVDEDKFSDLFEQKLWM